MQIFCLCFIVVQGVASIFINLHKSCKVSLFGLMPGTGIAMASTFARHAIFILMLNAVFGLRYPHS